MSAFVFTLVTFLLLFLTIAQQTFNSSDCNDNESFGVYNASGTYSIPGFSAPNSPPSTANWTYNTVVRVGPSGAFNTRFSIDTPAGTPNITSPHLPYLGCVVAFPHLPRETIQHGQDDTGDCLTTLDQQCVDDFLAAAKARAVSKSGTVLERGDVCDGFGTLPAPESCERFIEEGSTLNIGLGLSALSYPLIGTTTTGAANSSTNSICPPRDYFQWGTAPRDPDDYETSYDFALTQVTPVLTAVWLDGNETADNGEDGWSDARLVCMRARDVAERIREAESVPSAAGRAEMGWRLALAAIVGIIATGGWW